MKSKFYVSALSALVLGLTAGLATAGGNHPGGHHDSDALGEPGKVADVKRAISVDMTDAMRFTPNSISVKQGETVKFVVKNSGKVKHEMVLGSEKELKEHYEAMKKFPEMEHADPNMVTVQPGQTGEIIWKFSKAGVINFACLQPGHYDAGMKGAVNVAATSRSADGHASHKH